MINFRKKLFQSVDDWLFLSAERRWCERKERWKTFLLVNDSAVDSAGAFFQVNRVTLWRVLRWESKKFNSSLSILRKFTGFTAACASACYQIIAARTKTHTRTRRVASLSGSAAWLPCLTSLLDFPAWLHCLTWQTCRLTMLQLATEADAVGYRLPSLLIISDQR